MCQLAWLEPRDGFQDQVGKIGCLYQVKTKSPYGGITSSDCFWESENRLVPMQMDKIILPTSTAPLYRLMQNISRLPQLSLNVNEEDFDDRPLSPNFFERE